MSQRDKQILAVILLGLAVLAAYWLDRTRPLSIRVIRNHGGLVRQV
jgi:hypothetical protein